MQYDITIQENRYIKKFFSRFNMFEEAIKENIYHTLPEIIDTRPYKIKLAGHLKRGGKFIYEYKIVAKRSDFRAAYIIEGHQIEVFFISSTTIKKEFVATLSSTDLVDH